MRPKRRKSGRPRRTTLISDFTPPEGVPLSLNVAPLGARAVAQTIDLMLTLVFAGSILGLLALALNPPWSLLLGLGALLFFFVRAPYYVFAELFWQGRTLGKSITGLRVISADGRSLAPKAVVIRNLMKEAEVFAPLSYLVVAPYLSLVSQIAIVVWFAIVAAVPICNARRQRLGDFAADTYVIAEPQAILLPDLAAAATDQASEHFVFLPHNLEHYGIYELQTLEGLLHARPPSNPTAARRRAETLANVVNTIRSKIAFTEPVAEANHHTFLQAFYVAQRQHLEERQLLGDRRADKFYGRERNEDGAQTP